MEFETGLANLAWDTNLKKKEENSARLASVREREGSLALTWFLSFVLVEQGSVLPGRERG